MIFLFRKTKLFVLFASPLWLLAVLVGRLAVFTDFESTVTGIVYPVLVGVAGLYVIYAFAFIQAGKMHKGYNDILADECDVDLYLELYEPIREEGHKHKGTLFLTESSYATALHLAGRSDEALLIVRALAEREDLSRQRATDRADVFVDIGIYSVALGETAAAREAIVKAEEILSQLQLASPDYNRIFREITRLRHRADIADGKYDEALQYFTETGREYTSRYTKVNRMNTLAQIYRGQGNTRSLRKCLSYIAENGGTMAMARNARLELLTLPQEPENDREDAEESED